MKIKSLLKEISNEIKIINGKKIYEGDIHITNMNLLSLPNFEIDILEGDFDCSNNYLKNLNGSPKVIEGNFYCNNNKLKSLKGCPDNIIQTMNISNNSITEIDDFPKKIGALVCEKIPEDIKYRMIVLSGCNDSAREIFGDFVSLS